MVPRLTTVLAGECLSILIGRPIHSFDNRSDSYLSCFAETMGNVIEYPGNGRSRDTRDLCNLAYRDATRYSIHLCPSGRRDPRF